MMHGTINSASFFLRMSWRKEGRGWGVGAELVFPPSVLLFATSRSLGKCQRLFVI